jgi:hypothetical protein
MRIEDKLEEDARYRPKAAEAEKCDEYARGAIRAFEHFVGLYVESSNKKGNAGIGEGGGEVEAGGEKKKDKATTTPSKENFAPIFRAQFHLARLYGRLHVYGSGEAAHQGRVEGNKKSLAAYEKLRDFGRAHVARFGDEEGPSSVASKLAVCDEMIRMLPEKIARMHHQQTLFR